MDESSYQRPPQGAIRDIGLSPEPRTQVSNEGDVFLEAAGGGSGSKKENGSPWKCLDGTKPRGRNTSKEDSSLWQDSPEPDKRTTCSRKTPGKTDII